MREVSPGVWLQGGKRKRLLTRNLLPGRSFFEYEEHAMVQGTEYRVLDPKRSKLGAAFARGLQQAGIKPGCTVLYLGASHGYTPSYVSDIVGREGFVFCLDFAPRVVRDLVFVCEARENMAPLLEDAKEPSSYKEWLPHAGVDVVYMDIAQKGQVKIFLDNCDAFLKEGGVGLLALKARSEDVTANPKEVFKRSRQLLEGHPGVVVVDYRELDPFERDHAFFVVKKRGDR